MESILIVEDDLEMNELLRDYLQKRGYRAESASNASDAIKNVEETDYDLIISDLMMRDVSGLELLDAVKKIRDDAVVIIITAFGTIETAVEAIKRGAYHYITKPFKLSDIEVIIKKAIEEKRIKKENLLLREVVEKRYQFENIVGKSKTMLEVFELIKRVSATNSNVIIYGESGTGKELVAKAIHFNSPRKKMPFIAINCSAIPDGLLESELFGHLKGSFTGAHITKKGLFEEASGGSIFLDEIGDMSPNLQAKLLRVIENKEIRPVGGNEFKKVDTRIIAATHKNLESEVKKRRFREDLYYRLNVIPIKIPSLAERKEDIPLLTEHFLKKYSQEMNTGIRGINKEALDILIKHNWTGNVRELENIIERSVALSRHFIIQPTDLPDYFRKNEANILKNAVDKKMRLNEFEDFYIKRILQEVKGDKNKAAAILGINKRTLYRKIGKWAM
ncbi:MAG: sigma-54-dependent Fis family transcriptional regulator [Nitrospirae bacterium]|nr:sigma-54-dependent Fis family transcriptional regulator [Nitrospirota bacterium]